VFLGRWPERLESELAGHVAGCEVCREAAGLAEAFEGEADAARREASGRLPDAGLVWWRAQVRARREAERAAMRPITAAQLVAAAFGMGAAGAVFGATAEWFQAWLARSAAFVGSSAASVWSGWSALSETLTAVLANHLPIAAAVSLGVCLVPVIFYFTLREER
jgi:hypothetical protein